MKVWEMKSDLKTLVIMPLIYLEDNVDFSILDEYSSKIRFDGSFVNDWKPFEFVSSHRKKSKSDIVYIRSGTPVFTKNAKEKLSPYISDAVQFLPIEHELELYLVNVINVIDAVDFSRSICSDYSIKGFSEFEKIIFYEDIVKTQMIFKIKENSINYVYVTDAFKEIVERSKLKGFEFIEVWDSEMTTEIEAGMKRTFKDAVDQNSQFDENSLDWNNAYLLVESDKAVASGEWKLQKDKNGQIILGRLTVNLSYVWMDPDYYPPIVLTLKWNEVEKSDI
ncbi:imm11 family protein [Paenibacillus sp. IITD108]|uniref:imm11 family protein n=1 Tax=Paenibacillus sp. IITD108 TaxID=3116649 RepID=UPI002F40B4E8